MSTSTWAAEDVCGIDLPEHSLRTYLEQTDLRGCLERAAELVALRRLADIGAGFGRLSPVLAEFGEVAAFEREVALVSRGRFLLPDVTWHQVDRLEHLPAGSGSFDLALCFTVLQHIGRQDLAAVTAELKRIVGRPGAILLCEEVDPSHQWRAVPPDPRFTIGRPVEDYERLLAPFRLVDRWPRRIEPRGPEHMPTTGAYMLFLRG
jgi:SAM-dependent methyltransferase